MNMKSQKFRKSAELFGAIFGGLLISLPAIPQAVAQESTPKVNPSPSIFSEAPYNRSQAPVAPQPGARPPRPVPGDQTQQPSPRGVSSDQPPLLQPQQTPSAMISPTNGIVNIKLVNETAANVTFQVIGDTAPRSLQGKSDVTLQGLRAPVTVTFQREDGGQLIVTPQASSESGSLKVTFNEATDAAQGKSAMRIEQNGSVFLN
ncbi:hypothetical protein LC605_04425 [Nostoc sp. CHAB 5836]|uniref:hypothetical protein n=1 Tax=Nostoc sp. CHAB 5836 TaxID=2780404 RepID=UPI001E5646D6|nr:hypothetical protein [Nostoc sp. CHAB 5836]MCC5614335.1 hypothetical protein [Nostoc sp. CHAB 5836]